ncbi:MAG TPA: helix-turn-helix transcriptional regulator [Tepidisphaeraceae bacterium]|nr:helix-turn-helix transcriptional regulator [Tepidisphaeraceae bacterium]
MKKSKASVFVGSGNVFADLGLSNPEQRLAKAKLASEIVSIIDGSGMTQTEAGKVLAIDQPKVSMLMRGQLKDFSIERLLQFLVRLGRDVEIGIRLPRHGQAGFRVMAKAG